MEYITTDELSANLDAVLERITQNHEIISVTQDQGQSVIILNSQDYASLIETLYLLQNPANAERLRQGIEQHQQGQLKEIDVLNSIIRATGLVASIKNIA